MQSRTPQAATPMARRAFLAAAGVTVGAAPLLLRGGSAWAENPDAPAGRAFGFPSPDMTSKVTRDITFPIQGEYSWTDTYGACRGGCSRTHEGQDLIAAKLQKLVACVSGTVVGFSHESGGNSIYLQDADGWYYAYIHINNDSPGTDDGKNPLQWAFAPGVTMGSTVRRGQHIAYVGDSGNAEATVSHCHFEIRKPSADGVWKSQAVNPKYSLDAARPAPPQVPATTFVPWDNSADLVRQQYRDFLGREPDTGGLSYYRQVLDSGERTPAWLIEQLLNSPGCQNQAGTVYRLYRAYFNRDPEFGGFMYWLGRVRGGMAQHALAANFGASGEFTSKYGTLSNAGFVDTVYRNVLGRAADPAGKKYWTDQLDGNVINRHRMMLRFSESDENVRKLKLPTTVVLVHTLMVGRMPSASAISTWNERFVTQASSPQALIDTFRKSNEYRTRINSL